MSSDTRVLPPVCKALFRSGSVSILVLACAGSAGTPPSLSEVGNSVVAGIYDEPIQLTDAVYEGKPFVAGGSSRPRVQLLDTHVTGDLDGAPGDEAAVILVENSGGSGSFAYLAVMSRQDDGVVNLGTAALGDRVRIRSVRIQNETVVVDLLQAGPDDALCCPGEPAIRTWRLVDGALLEVTPEDG